MATMRLSKFAMSVQPSATLAIAAKAKQMRADGIPVFDFSLGEPDQTTPLHICEAAHKAVLGGATHYTPSGGLKELREAVAAWYGRFHKWNVTADHVVICSGAKHSIHNALASTVGPGDEVIVPAPYWVSYGDLISMTGATPVIVPTTVESKFKLSPDQYRKAVTPRTRLLLLNSPCNPTGSVYSRTELQALADAVLKTDVGIISDEIYEHLFYGTAKPTCIASLSPEIAERTITVSGCSKSFAMTGWRMGWGVGPVHVIKAMEAIQSQETGCPSSVSQAAALAALQGSQSCVADMLAQYTARREFICRRLREIPGIKFQEPDGAFYVFFDVSSYFGKTIGGKKINDSATFCSTALDDALVNLVPGSAFGLEGYARLSYSCATAQLEGGLSALANWLAKAK